PGVVARRPASTTARVPVLVDLFARALPLLLFAAEKSGPDAPGHAAETQEAEEPHSRQRADHNASNGAATEAPVVVIAFFGAVVARAKGTGWLVGAGTSDAEGRGEERRDVAVGGDDDWRAGGLFEAGLHATLAVLDALLVVVAADPAAG